MKRGVLLLLAAAMLSLSAVHASFARAEGDMQTETLSAADSVALLSERVEKAERRLSKLPTVSGFMQITYMLGIRGDEPLTSQFRVRRARVTLAGRIYKELADYDFMVEFADSPKVLDAFLRITPWQQFNVQAGVFRPPFTLENCFYGATTMELIEYPQIVSSMTTIGDLSGAGRGAAGRDLGVQLYGGFFNGRGFSTLQYYAGMFNGNGLDYNVKALKDFSAMLRVNPVKDLAIIGSVYLGRLTPPSGGGSRVRNRWSAGFMYDDGKWFSRGEYIGGVTGIGGLNFKPLVLPADGRLHTDGAYIMGGRWFCGHRVAAVVRADYFTQNTSARHDTTDICYTAGAVYTPWKYLRLQLNYALTTYSYNPAGSVSRPVDNRVTVMVTGMF